MGTIIKQRPAVPALPDWRNLGTVLRVLLAVNGAAALVVFAHAPELRAFVEQWTAVSTLVEPHLLLELALLWALAPQLDRLPAEWGIAAVFALGVGVALAVQFTVGAVVFERAPDVIGRHVFFTLVATALLMAYFHLRARALSPAITEARLQALQARIRPHFLFNSINGVLSLVRSDPVRARRRCSTCPTCSAC